MKFVKTGLIVTGVIGLLGTLGACSTYDDRYYREPSVSVGVSSGPYYEHPRRYRDNDGDGIPNRFDDHPNNPYRP